MKKVLKVLLIVLILLAIAAGSVAIWQWKNIQSIMLGVKEESREIAKRRNDNQTKLVEDINTYMDEPVREMTEEEKRQVEEGKTSLSDVYQKIFEEKKESLEKNEQNTTANNSLAKDEIISRYMAELYRLQNEFTARAEVTIKQGASYYESIKAHSQDPVARSKTIAHFTPVVRGMESECDAKVEKVISSLKTELEKIGADTTILASIRATYANEKQLKLSYYANKYLK